MNRKAFPRRARPAKRPDVGRPSPQEPGRPRPRRTNKSRTVGDPICPVCSVPYYEEGSAPGSGGQGRGAGVSRKSLPGRGPAWGGDPRSEHVHGGGIRKERARKRVYPGRACQRRACPRRAGGVRSGIRRMDFPGVFLGFRDLRLFPRSRLSQRRQWRLRWPPRAPVRRPRPAEPRAGLRSTAARPAGR